MSIKFVQLGWTRHIYIYLLQCYEAVEDDLTYQEGQCQNKTKVEKNCESYQDPNRYPVKVILIV